MFWHVLIFVMFLFVVVMSLVDAMLLQYDANVRARDAKLRKGQIVVVEVN